LLDKASFAVAGALGTLVAEQLARCKCSIAYLVDNEIAHDRLLAAIPLFGAMGIGVACPEHLALQLARADGLAVDDIRSERLRQYGQEAGSVAVRLYGEIVRSGRPVMWISAVADLELLQHLADELNGSGYVGVFRNCAPEDGTNVQVFRDSSGQVD